VHKEVDEDSGSPYQPHIIALRGVLQTAVEVFDGGAADCILRHTGVSSYWVLWHVFFERYTRVLLEASPECPIHFLKIYRPTVSPAKNSLVYFLSITCIDHPGWRSHREEAKRGPPSGPRLPRNEGVMMALLLP
jgi:hypothetical protein